MIDIPGKLSSFLSEEATITEIPHASIDIKGQKIINIDISLNIFA